MGTWRARAHPPLLIDPTRESPLCPRCGEARRAIRTGRGGPRQAHPALLTRAMSELHPLAGTTVVDVTSSLAGPTATQLLAALGADVVKVEPLAGDHARAWGPPFLDGESAMFLAANAGKRSLAVELGDERGREIVLRLAAEADVFLQSLRP